MSDMKTATAEAEITVDTVNTTIMREGFATKLGISPQGEDSDESVTFKLKHSLAIPDISGLSEQDCKYVLSEFYEDMLSFVLRQYDTAILEAMRNNGTFISTKTNILNRTSVSIAEQAIGLNQLSSLNGMVLSFDVWNDIRTDPSFSEYFDPTCKHEQVLMGFLGGLKTDCGTYPLVSDAFRNDTFRATRYGEWFLVTGQSNQPDRYDIVHIDEITDDGHHVVISVDHTVKVNTDGVVWGRVRSWKQ